MLKIPTSNSRTGLIFILSACVGACSTVSNRLEASVGVIKEIVKPYVPDIGQGNAVTKEKAELIKPGMTRGQVQGILGTPLLSSLFHSDRWDYIFILQRAGDRSFDRRVVVHFKSELVDLVEMKNLPSEAEFSASLKGENKNLPVPTLTMTPEALRSLPKIKAEILKSAPPIHSDINYPPLEAEKQ